MSSSMRLLVLICLFVFNWSCQPEKSKSDVDENEKIFSTVIIDTIRLNKTNFIFEGDDEQWMTEANYMIYYLGPKKDTLFMYPLLGIYDPPPGHEDDYTVDSEEYKNPNEAYFADFFEKSHKEAADLITEIRVDTTTRIGNNFPVYLTNKSTDTSFVGFGERLPLILEAIDSTGNWRPIQKRFVYMCGTGLASIMLPPNEVVVTFVPVFKGNYKTKLRITDGNNHSQSFEGKLFYTQFERKRKFKRPSDD